jgi:hypothetical protein
VPLLAVTYPPERALVVKVGATVTAGARFVGKVAADNVIKDPCEFVRVVATVTYWPASAATCVYVEEVAPLIAEQVSGIVDVAEETVAEQSYHCHVDVPVGYSVHEPLEAVNVLYETPAVREPLTVGAVTKTGADCDLPSWSYPRHDESTLLTVKKLNTYEPKSEAVTV